MPFSFLRKGELDAIGYLSFFIKLNEGHPNFTEATNKWHRDRNFLTGYVPGSMRKVNGKIVILPKDDSKKRK